MFRLDSCFIFVLTCPIQPLADVDFSKFQTSRMPQSDLECTWFGTWSHLNYSAPDMSRQWLIFSISWPTVLLYQCDRGMGWSSNEVKPCSGWQYLLFWAMNSSHDALNQISRKELATAWIARRVNLFQRLQNQKSNQKQIHVLEKLFVKKSVFWQNFCFLFLIVLFS